MPANGYIKGRGEDLRSPGQDERLIARCTNLVQLSYHLWAPIAIGPQVNVPSGPLSSVRIHSRCLTCKALLQGLSQCKGFPNIAYLVKDRRFHAHILSDFRKI